MDNQIQQESGEFEHNFGSKGGDLNQLIFKS